MFVLDNEKTPPARKVTLSRARGKGGDINLFIDDVLAAWITPSGEFWVSCLLEASTNLKPANFTIHRSL